MKANKSKTLRFRLTASYIIFAFLLMGILWLMQSVLLNTYYEYSMRNKMSTAVNSVSTVYSNAENLTINDFSTVIGTLSQESDVQFYVEAVDGSFSVSSIDQVSGGRTFLNAAAIIKDARAKLFEEKTDTAAFTIPGKTGNTIVEAHVVNSSFSRPVIIVYALAMLSPIGPAVGIIRSQLLFVTAFAIILGSIVALFISLRLSSPVKGMSEKAKELAKGNYDIHFDGGNEFMEMDELADSLNEAAADLKKSDSLQRDLMANVSHDLRTPLTMIKSYAEMIRDLSGDDPKKRDEHLGVIIEESDRLSDLVNDVLALSRMQAGITELNIEKFDLQKAAESVLSTYMVMVNEGYQFAFETLPGDVIIEGDERRVKQVIANLISNAVRYSGDQKEIRVVLTKEKDKVRCTVSDKGVGIAQEDLEQIWHRYKKASNTGQRSQNGGSGLGLSIAAEILNRHNAEYGVESVLGEGSSFWFEFPLA